jgi:hypothetical protein
MFLPRWRRLASAGLRRTRCPRAPVRVARLCAEYLESRYLLSFTQFNLPTPMAEPLGITTGPDGALCLPKPQPTKSAGSPRRALV